MSIRSLLLFLSTLTLLIGEKGHCVKGTDLYPSISVENNPWFTGPLLSPSGYVISYGYCNFEPYVLATDTYAIYNRHWRPESIPSSWDVTSLDPLWIGFAEKFDFFIFPQFNWGEVQGHSATRFGDLALGVDIQILEEKLGKSRPAIKLVARETIPTGKYQKLNPDKLGADISGAGAYISSVGVVLARLFLIEKTHFLSTRFFLNYSIPTKVHVKGFNTFGGGYGTNGCVDPGNFLTTIAGFEYNLTRNWVFALDVQHIYTQKTRFKGYEGITAFGSPAIIGAPSSNQLSLAPAIEYNFNESVGIIGGVWFSIAGRNATDFVSAVLALNWFFSLRHPRSN